MESAETRKANATAILSTQARAVDRGVLLGASLLLIGVIAGTWRIVPFVIAVTTTAYLLLLVIDRSATTSKVRKLSCLSVVFALVVLYALAQYSGVVGTLNADTASLIDQSLLTLGLPFYLLVVIAVYVEVLFSRMALPKFADFASLLIYFPKFLCGPIEPPAAFLKQVASYRFRYDARRLDDGFSWMLLGILFKFGISGGLEALVLRDEAQSPLVILASATALELRLYFDLAGYSFIAFGLSRMLGIDLTLNFSHPFLSANVREFWRNWHISLGHWYRTYVYLPLRPYFKSERAAHAVVPLVVFLLSAMWHGITLNFVLWGLFHGAVFVAFITLLSRYAWPRWSGLLGLWSFLIFGRLLFMDSDSPRLLQKLAAVLSIDAWHRDLETFPSAVLLAQFPMRNVGYVALAVIVIVLEAWSRRRHPAAPYGLFRTTGGFIGCLILTLLLIHSAQPGFIYARQ